MAASRPSKRRPRGQHDPAYRVLCDLVRRAREDAGLTQRELAARLKRDRSYVWKCEQGERRLDVVDVIRWCAACGCDPIGVFKRMTELGRQ